VSQLTGGSHLADCRLGRLPQRGPRQADRSLQGRLSDDNTRPQRIQQLVLVHYPVTVQEQVVE